MSQFKIYKELDLSVSASCAGPIGELFGVLEELREGEAVKVILEGEETKNNIEDFVRRIGYSIVQSTRKGDKFILLIAKV